jgi:hypothetical protein
MAASNLVLGVGVGDVERLTGTPARTIEAFVAARGDFYLD